MRGGETPVWVPWGPGRGDRENSPPREGLGRGTLPRLTGGGAQKGGPGLGARKRLETPKKAPGGLPPGGRGVLVALKILGKREGAPHV